MEKYRACDIAVVAIILNNLFTRGSWGSTARSSEAAKALLDLKDQSQRPEMSEVSHLSSQRHILASACLLSWDRFCCWFKAVPPQLNK